MNDNEQRDELARELFIADNSNQPREASIVDWEWFEATDNYRGRIQHYKDMAAGVIAAGYRKPRTITTVEELDALPIGVVVLSAIGIPWEKDVYTEAPASPWWCSPGDPHQYPATRVGLPATVLHEPEAEVAR